MRIAIDFCIDRDELLCMSEVTDTSCAESCINFITSNAESVTVYLEQNGATVETLLPVSRCSACFVLDDTLIRTAGEFTVYASGCMPLRFVVSETIPAGLEYSINLTDGAFYVRRAASSGGGEGTSGMFAFHIDESGHLICTYDSSEPPPLSIDANGHLIWTLEG